MRHLLLLGYRRELLLGQLLAVEELIIGYVGVLVPFKILLEIIVHGAAVEVRIVDENTLVHYVHWLPAVVGVQGRLRLAHRPNVVAVTFFVDLITLNCFLVALRIQIFGRLHLAPFVLGGGAVTHRTDFVEEVARQVSAGHDVAGHFATDHHSILFLCFPHQLSLLERGLL